LPEYIDFALEAGPNFDLFTWNRYTVPAHNLVKYLTNVEEIDAICHDSSLNRRRMILIFGMTS